MICPDCNGENTGVKRTTDAGRFIVRRRFCHCGTTWDTEERVISRSLLRSNSPPVRTPIPPVANGVAGGVGGGLPSDLFPVSGSGSDLTRSGSLEASGSEVLRKIRKSPESLPGFDRFYAEYPRKVARPHALAMWKREGCEEIAASVLLGLRVHLPDLTSRPRDKVPHPATFLTGRRWEDPAEENARPSANGARPAATQQRIDVGLEWLEEKRRATERT